ncbi:hypothetical protein HID58_095000 [Brassica napus]|uniref:Uncharacterized protein n=1 Tax=Brassica napus TaxID=3708 RepID=A0ABQ7X7L9_BRANA|nr:hypothetical protein HID58_095000 [Brassica napus]
MIVKAAEVGWIAWEKLTLSKEHATRRIVGESIAEQDCLEGNLLRCILQHSFSWVAEYTCRKGFTNGELGMGCRGWRFNPDLGDPWAQGNEIGTSSKPYYLLKKNAFAA